MCVQLHGGERAPLVCTCEFIDESQMLFYGWVARLLDPRWQAACGQPVDLRPDQVDVAPILVRHGRGE
jgi:hypothetical protein